MTTAAPSGAAGLPPVDCHKRIGVQGDRSCPALREHVHCKNCPVYADLAQAWLDRDLPGGYGQSWARHFAQGTSAADGERESLLVFRVGAEWLALPTAAIDEVARVPVIRSLPHRRGGAVLGIVNVRGELVVCVALGRVLNVEAAAAAAGHRTHARLLVLRRGAARFATPVDEVHGTCRVTPSELLPTPATVGRARGAFTRHVLAMTERVVGCLDDEALFNALERSCS